MLIVKALIVSILLATLPAHGREPIHKVVWLTTQSTPTIALTHAKEAAKDVNFYYFVVDEGRNILSHFENQFPEHMANRPENEKLDYLERHITPKIRAYAPELMRSEVGLSLVKLYRIERLPAVVINDKYITYGLSVSDSMDIYYGGGR